MAKALILGATGLTGSFLLKEILNDPFFTEITVWARRPMDISHPKLKDVVTDFETLPDIQADIVFSCLGTTKKKTPDPEIYRWIEIGLPLKVAEELLPKGLKQFHYVSALGVGPNGVGSYAKNKWEAEQKLSSVGMESVYLYRPALIFGPRPEKRLMEDFSNVIFSVIDPLFIGGLKKYKRIHGQTIAKAMIKSSKTAKKGNHVLDSGELQELGV